MSAAEHGLQLAPTCGHLDRCCCCTKQPAAPAPAICFLLLPPAPANASPAAQAPHHPHRPRRPSGPVRPALVDSAGRGRRHPRRCRRQSGRSGLPPPGRPCRPRTAAAAGPSGTSPASPTEGAGPGLPRASCSLFCPRKHAAAGAAQTPQTTAKPPRTQPACPHRSRPPQPAPARQRGQSNTRTGLDAAVASSGRSRPT